jgi:hypothetical protein
MPTEAAIVDETTIDESAALDVSSSPLAVTTVTLAACSRFTTGRTRSAWIVDTNINLPDTYASALSMLLKYPERV